MELFNLSEFKHAGIISDPLSFQTKLKAFFDSGPEGYEVIKAEGEVINHSFINGVVYLAPGARIKPFSYIEGRLLLEEGASVGPHAYIRKDVIVGASSELSRCEVKNSVIMDGVKVHHHSYIGDSVVGNNVNIAAGFVTANLRFDRGRVKVKGFGLAPSHKFGALIGDGVKTMVNASLMPGAVVEPRGVVNVRRV